MKKTLTTIIILFFATHVYPQKDTVRQLGMLFNPSDSSVYVFEIYDTIPVWIQCQDTLIHYDVINGITTDTAYYSNRTKEQEKEDTTGYSKFLWHTKATHDTTGHWTNNTIYGIRGYQVRKNTPSFDTWGCGLNECIGWRDHFEHIMFLDEKKQPLQYFVWSYK